MAIKETKVPDDVVAPVPPSISAGRHFTVAFSVSSKKLRQDMGDQEYSDLLASIVKAAIHDRYPDVMIQRLEEDVKSIDGSRSGADGEQPAEHRDHERMTPEQIAEAAADEATEQEVENTGLAFATARLVIKRLREAGYLFYKDEGKHCPRCGAPDPDGYTDEEMGG